MHYLELWKTTLRYDPDSPTYLSYISTGLPAGIKVKNNGLHGGPSYTWWFRWGDIRFNLKSVIYYLYHGVEAPQKMFIKPIDGDLDNLNPENFALYPKAQQRSINHRLNIEAYKQFKNVILPKDNPDYFKHPSEWTNPEAIAALEQEKANRISGNVTPNFKKFAKRFSGVS